MMTTLERYLYDFQMVKKQEICTTYARGSRETKREKYSVHLYKMLSERQR